MSAAPLVSLLALASLGGGTQPGDLGSSGIAPPSSCVQCHSQPGDASSLLPNDRYRGTLMHLASVDPIYLAALEIAYADTSAGAELCVRCHAPTGWLAGRGTPTNGSFLSSSDKHGISCDLCHRATFPSPVLSDGGVPDLSDGGALDGGALDGGGAAEPDWSALLLENTQLFVQQGGTVKHGPYETPFENGHSSVASPLFKDSRLCAHCHEVTNTFVTKKELDGADTGRPMPVERTYTEWKQSAFADPVAGKTCQGCHMKSATSIAATQSPERQIGDHEIVGGNTLVPRMVAFLYQNRDLAEFRNLTADADRITEAARRLLQEESAELEVVGASPERGVTVRVTNKTGHKLPTGYAEGRRMWISHEVTYLDGAPPLRSGTPDPSTWDFVSGEDPARIWEVKLGVQAEGQPSFHFALVDAVYKDNRIPPEGFIPTEDTAPVGHEFETLAGGQLAHWDEVELPLGAPTCWPVLVDVKLRYQTASGEYYRFLRDNAPAARADLEAAWSAVGGSIPEVMRELRVAVLEDGTVLEDDGSWDASDCGTPAQDAGSDAGTAARDGGDGADAGPTPTGPGCACRTSSVGAHEGLALLALSLAALARRRRQGEGMHR